MKAGVGWALTLVGPESVPRSRPLGDRKSSALRAGIRVQASEMKVRFCLYLNVGILFVMTFFFIHLALSKKKKKNCIVILFILVTESGAHL